MARRATVRAGVVPAAPDAGKVLRLSDGSTASVEEGGLFVRDEDGRLLVRYKDGAAEICAPSGDLTLAAPCGRVVVKSGVDVTIESARDIVNRAGRRVDLVAGTPKDAQVRIEPDVTTVSTSKLKVVARSSRFVAGQATVIARVIATTAERVATNAGEVELQANRVVERARDVFRDVADLAQTRVGRARTIVRDVYALYSRRTVMVSDEETSVDGTKILLG